MDAGTGAEVDDVIGAADGFLVVLDDDHGVADVAQLSQRLQQAFVVALMQADRWLVKHVHDAGQTRADLRSQPDALRLAAGEGLRRAIERQVVEADVDQELQSADDLLQHLLGDPGLVAGKLKRDEIVTRCGKGQATDLMQGARVIHAADAHVARLFAQAAAVAGGTGAIADQAR